MNIRNSLLIKGYIFLNNNELSDLHLYKVYFYRLTIIANTLYLQFNKNE